jgi:hypothetical protein
VYTLLTKKNSEHSRKYERQETGDSGTENGKQRNKGQLNRATDKRTLVQLKGVRGQRKEGGRQGTDHMKQVQRMRDKEQRRKTGDRRR